VAAHRFAPAEGFRHLRLGSPVPHGAAAGIRQAVIGEDYTLGIGGQFAGRTIGRAPANLTARETALMKTFVATPANRERNWLVVDATGKTLGRLATQIADALRGKNKPEYTPHCDVGDFVIVVNAEKVTVTGKKREDKRYYRHSGYPGGLRSRTFEEMQARRPEEIIRLAVKGMVPRSRLGRQQLRKLKIYAGPDHPHQAQQPQTMEVEA
jgi:large subunit ribosomal protein L13